MMKQVPPQAKILPYIHRVFLALFYILLRATVGLYCRIRFKPRYERPRDVLRLKPPFLVLADHVHPMDMFLNGLGLRPVIHWVAADANFRTPFMKFVMTILAGAIAKSKNRSDMVTLSRMKILTETGCVIGVYQEGERSWDGVNLPPVKGTDKLIRFLKIPVVYAHLEGAYLDHPRWSWSGNKTPINVRYEIIIGADEIDRIPLAEIGRRIEQAGTYNEWNFQKSALQPLLGEKRAENCELVCFLCPGCHSVNTIYSSGNDFRCSHCDMRGSINRFGCFEWKQPPGKWPDGTPFDNIRDWNLWQIAFFQKKTDEISENNPDLFWEDRNTVFLSRGNRHRQMEQVGLGSARFYSDRIEFESAENTIIMPLDSITSFSVFRQFFTEFYYNKTLYRFSFTNRSVSGYKWLMLYRMITEKRANRR